MIRRGLLQRLAVTTLAMAPCLSAFAQTTPDNMPANSWLAVPDSKMQAVAPKSGQFPGTWGVTGPNSVIVAWGGAAFDTKRSRLVLWGGGHADYYGNEVYTFDVPTLKWTRLTDPFVNPVKDQEVNGDGTPNSRHTYGGLAYIAHADRFFGQGGSLAGVGFAKCDRTWTFDFETKSWSDRAPAASPGGGFGCTCAYDPVTKRVWWGSGSGKGLWSYAFDTNTWTKHNGDGDFYEYTSAIDTKRGLMVVVGNRKVFAYDIRNESFTRQNWTTTGGDAFIAKGKPGLDYDPVSDRIVGWHGGAVYALNVETKVWTAYDAPGAPKTTGNGIYGRWRYVPSVNAFIVVTDWASDVYFYKLSSAKGVLPDAGIIAAADASPARAPDATIRDTADAGVRAPGADAVANTPAPDAGAATGPRPPDARSAGAPGPSAGSDQPETPDSPRASAGCACSLGAAGPSGGLALVLLPLALLRMLRSTARHVRLSGPRGGLGSRRRAPTFR